MIASDATLSAQAAQGSLLAFTSLVNRHQQALRSFLRRLTGNWAEADDLAQEVLVDAWQQMARFDASREFRTWLCGMAYRKYLAERRAWWRRWRREQAHSAELSLIDDAQRDVWLDLRRALMTLPEEQRAVVALCVAEQWSHSEVAAALNLPLGTVKSHVQRSRLRLGQFLSGYQSVDGDGVEEQ